VRFCLVTTFFGAHSFGGDAAYVERQARALARRGHDVHVIHCADAFDAVKGAHPPRPFDPPPDVTIHTLRSPLRGLSPLATQATGRPWLKLHALRTLLDDPATDVVHFHNISLVGGPDILRLGRHATRLMTAHEHWLICPMHLLWKFDRKTCDGPTCARCMIAGHRPPQLWRGGDLIPRSLRNLDALLFPSRHARDEHIHRGIHAARMTHLPYFLPDEWSGGLEDEEPDTQPSGRPYLAAAGRLVAMKGFQTLIPLMKYLPEVDLRLAGTGPYEPLLRELARDLPNVRFEGLLGGRDLARLFHGARAVVVPSLFPETFGYVALEAFAVRTPTVVHRGGGALAEVASDSGGGLTYRTEAELLLALRRLVHDDPLRAELADRGYRKRTGDWSEAAHMDRYFELIREVRSGRPSAMPAPHAARHQPSRTHSTRAD
jgi:glycosyltransferase involved in cell wall biosynthesis